MKCILCKGRKTFFVKKYQEEFDALLGGQGEYYGHVDCPRCKGTGVEKYLPMRLRVLEIHKCYNQYYGKYLKNKYIDESNKEILKKLEK